MTDQDVHVDCNEGMEGGREKSEISPRAALFIGKSGNRGTSLLGKITLT